MRLVVLILSLVLILLVVGACWYVYKARPTETASNTTGPSSSETTPERSAATRSVLDDLTAPVDFRFYRSMNQAAKAPELQAFARRVGHLLSRYHEAAAGNIRVIERDPLADPDAETAAITDGVKPQLLDGGGVCYLGLAVVFATDFSEGGANVTLGTALVLGSAVAFAIYQLMAKRYISEMGATLFTSVALSAAAVCAASVWSASLASRPSTLAA